MVADGQAQPEGTVVVSQVMRVLADLVVERNPLVVQLGQLAHPAQSQRGSLALVVMAVVHLLAAVAAVAATMAAAAAATTMVVAVALVISVG